MLALALNTLRLRLALSEEFTVNMLMHLRSSAEAFSQSDADGNSLKIKHGIIQSIKYARRVVVTITSHTTITDEISSIIDVIEQGERNKRIKQQIANLHDMIRAIPEVVIPLTGPIHKVRPSLPKQPNQL